MSALDLYFKSDNKQYFWLSLTKRKQFYFNPTNNQWTPCNLKANQNRTIWNYTHTTYTISSIGSIAFILNIKGRVHIFWHSCVFAFPIHLNWTEIAKWEFWGPWEGFLLLQIRPSWSKMSLFVVGPRWQTFRTTMGELPNIKAAVWDLSNLSNSREAILVQVILCRP